MNPALFVDNLRRLDRDERSHLAAFAFANPAFGLGDDFKQALQRALKVEVPDNALIATGFQISLLFAAAAMAAEDQRRIFPTGGGIEAGNQEDIGLLIAWANDDTATVVLVEALGIAGWGGKRLLSKAHRLGDALGYEKAAPKFSWIEPHFVIAAPSAPPDDLMTLEWPGWMVDGEGRPAWLRLQIAHDLLKVTRTTPDGTPKATGGFWTVERA